MMMLTAVITGCADKAEETKAAESTSGSDIQESAVSKEETAEEAIEIAIKPMTEQYILGEMLKLVIEDSTDYSVEITKVSAAVQAISIRPWKRVNSTFIRNTIQWMGDGFEA